MELTGFRILLVDDHAVVRSSLGLLLASHGAVIAGEAADGESAVRLALQLRPDVILMDISLPGMSGIEAARAIIAAWPGAKILALTMHSEDMYLVAFLEAGGSGYVRKEAADRDVIDAIQTILRGETFLDAAGVKTLVRQHQPGLSESLSPGPEVLSERERLVLEQTVKGFTSKEIGKELNISSHTVDTYRARIMEKLGLEHRHQLVEYALRHHLLE